MFQNPAPRRGTRFQKFESNAGSGLHHLGKRLPVFVDSWPDAGGSTLHRMTHHLLLAPFSAWRVATGFSFNSLSRMPGSGLHHCEIHVSPISCRLIGQMPSMPSSFKCSGMLIPLLTTLPQQPACRLFFMCLISHQAVPASASPCLHIDPLPPGPH